jgi:hypothetical protein
MALHRDGGQDRLAHEVMAGQHYVQVNAYRNVWEVRDVFHLSDDIAHARLARVDEPTIMKTVSCISLVEGAFFELLPEAEPEVDAESAADEIDDDGPGDINAQWRQNMEALPAKQKSTLFRRWLRS